MSVLFSEEDRRIYKCPVTGAHYDPLTLRRALLLERDYNKAVGLMGDEDPVNAARGEEAVVQVGRKVFKMLPIDLKTGEGHTDTAVLQALTAFTRWLRGKPETAQS